MELITQRSLIKDYLADAESFWHEWRQKAAKALDADTCEKADVIKALGVEATEDLAMPICDECQSGDKSSYIQFNAQYGNDIVNICNDCMALASKSIQDEAASSKKPHLTPDEQIRWQQIYDDELKRPDWSNCNTEFDKQRINSRAKLAADIAIGKTVWRIG